MKKSILFLIMFILCLTSCNSTKENGYKSFICDSTNDVMGITAEFDFWNGVFSKKQNMADKTCIVNGKEYTAEYKTSLIYKMNSYTTDVYVDENYIEFGLRSDNGNLAFFNLMNAEFFDTEPYLPDVENPRETAISLASEIACEYVDDITEYTKIVEEPRIGYKEKNGITYEITYYVTTFAKKVNGYFSSDYISVKVTSKGNLASIMMGDINAFENISLEFDAEAVNQSISDKIDSAYKKNKLSVKETNIRDQKIVLTPDKEVCMFSYVDVGLYDISKTEVTTGVQTLTPLKKQ